MRVRTAVAATLSPAVNPGDACLSLYGTLPASFTAGERNLRAKGGGLPLTNESRTQAHRSAAGIIQPEGDEKPAALTQGSNFHTLPEHYPSIHRGR